MRITRFLLPLMFLGIALAGGILVVWPKYQGFYEVRKEIQIKKDRLEEGEQALARLRDFQRQAEEYKEEFEKLEIGVPSDMALPAVYYAIQEMSATSGMFLTDISSQRSLASQQNELLEVELIEFRVTGSYEGTKQLLAQLKSSLRMLNVQSIDIGVADPATGTLGVQVSVEVYSKK